MFNYYSISTLLIRNNNVSHIFKGTSDISYYNILHFTIEKRKKKHKTQRPTIKDMKLTTSSIEYDNANMLHKDDHAQRLK